MPTPFGVKTYLSYNSDIAMHVAILVRRAIPPERIQTHKCWFSVNPAQKWQANRLCYEAFDAPIYQEPVRKQQFFCWTTIFMFCL